MGDKFIRMHLYKLIFLLTVLAMGLSGHATAQPLDSLLDDRQHKFREYSVFRDSMKERTWINMVELNKRAAAVIALDNELVLNHLDHEVSRNTGLTAQVEKIEMERAFLKKELENREGQLAEHRHLNNLFLMIALGLSIALIISLVFLAAFFRRNRQASKELERLWSMSDDQNALLRDKEKDLNKQVRLLEVENQAMQQELSLLVDQKSAAREKLEEEIRSRQKAEKEIKELIGQIKKK